MIPFLTTVYRHLSINQHELVSLTKRIDSNDHDSESLNLNLKMCSIHGKSSICDILSAFVMNQINSLFEKT